MRKDFETGGCPATKNVTTEHVPTDTLSAWGEAAEVSMPDVTRNWLRRRAWLAPAFGAALSVATPTGDAGGQSPMAPPAVGSPQSTPDLRPFIAEWIPRRAPHAMSGSAFAAATKGWSARRRQEAALTELRAGNVPSFVRRFVPVELEYVAPGRRWIEATVWVSTDYLAIGSDTDYLHIPLDRPGAFALARSLHCMLPTRKIVDAISEQADVHLSPRPLPPGPRMSSNDYYVRHDEIIRKQLAGRPPSGLVTGHKKDLVVSNRLLGRDRVAIYGWHRLNGEPIQPLSTVHGARYADYSHGVRLVYDVVAIDGEFLSIYDVLGDPALGSVLSYEGHIAKKVMLR